MSSHLNNDGPERRFLSEPDNPEVEWYFISKQAADFSSGVVYFEQTGMVVAAIFHQLFLTQKKLFFMKHHFLKQTGLVLSASILGLIACNKDNNNPAPGTDNQLYASSILLPE